MTTLTVAATAADSALDAERRKLTDIELRKKQCRDAIERNKQEGLELAATLSQITKDELAQQERIEEVIQMLRDHTQALVEAMAHRNLEPQAFVASETPADVLGLPAHLTPPEGIPLPTEAEARHSHENNTVVTQALPSVDLGAVEVTPVNPDGDPANGDHRLNVNRKGGGRG